jgi:hypothetical protein
LFVPRENNHIEPGNVTAASRVFLESQIHAYPVRKWAPFLREEFENRWMNANSCEGVFPERSRMFPTNLSNNVSERKKAISGKVGCLREK